MKRISWTAFYSQTGSEIVNICKALDIKPTVVVTNNFQKTSEDSKQFFKDNEITITILPFNPSADDYLLVHNTVRVITLNGWLRVLSPYPCKLWKGKVYNGHPGLISKNADLKGKDPQQRAFEAGYREIGSVIHEVTDKVDEGKIIIEKSVTLEGVVDLELYYSTLRTTSLETWKQFFKFKQLI